MQKLNSVPFKSDPKLPSAGCIECRVAVDTLLVQLSSNQTTVSKNIVVPYTYPLC
jgi:hypothetical protein